MWDHPFKHLVLARDRLINFFTEFIIHRLDWKKYILPALLSTGVHSPANFDHILWKCCQVIHDIWVEVTSYIAEILGTPISMSVSLCLLRPWYQIMIIELYPIASYFMAGRKVILLYWEKSNAATGSFWKGLVNLMIQYYRATYLSGLPPKNLQSMASLVGIVLHYRMK